MDIDELGMVSQFITTGTILGYELNRRRASIQLRSPR
jgi:hypothetical protein